MIDVRDITEHAFVSGFIARMTNPIADPYNAFADYTPRAEDIPDASPQPERRPAADLERAAHEFKAHWHYGPDPADVYDYALRAAFAALGITFDEPGPV